MSLPSIDFELMYWRARRRLQRVRAALRFHVSQARARAHLAYLHHFGRLPEQPEPEETVIYRCLWACVIAGTIAIIVIDGTIGEEEFLRRADAVKAAMQGNAVPAVDRLDAEPPSLAERGTVIVNRAQKRPQT